MKKKIISVILSVMISAIFIFPFSSCHKHEWTSWTLEERTCLTRGAERYECDICGKSKTKYLPALGGEHRFEEVLYESTCSNIGYSKYVCSRCGYYFEADYTPIRHEYKDGVCVKCGGHKEGSEGLKFVKTDIGYSVADYTGSDKNVIIPTEHEGESVYGVEENAFFGNADIESVEMPLSVSAVGVSAFEGCVSLKKVTLSEGVSSIGHRAFYGCKALQSIDFSRTVNVGDYAFYGCASLKVAILSEDATYIGDRAFYGCKSLIAASVPDLVMRIYDYTFYGCSSLTDLRMGENCHDIGKSAFYGCTSLKKVEFGEGLEDIDFMAFKNCSSLREVKFGKKLNSISAFAFEGTALESAAFADTESWEYRADKQGTGESADLSDPAKNAVRLSDGYASFYWVRNRK